MRLSQIINSATANGVTAGPIYTGTTYAVIPEMTITLTTGGGNVLVLFSSVVNAFTTNVNAASFALFRDGVLVSLEYVYQTTNFQETVMGIAFIDVAPAAGSHTYTQRWKVLT